MVAEAKNAVSKLIPNHTARRCAPLMIGANKSSDSSIPAVAINCASFSCPNLVNEAFTEAKLESQLQKATNDFINDKTKNTIGADKIEISKIFDWFADDFKTKGTLIDYLNQYSAVKINTNAKIRFKEYNWSLNE